MNIIYFKELNSTNTYAKENIQTLPDRSVVSADAQTNGYGRFERSWVDVGVDNIYMTIVLKPSEFLDEKYANLTQYLSVCLCKKLQKLSLQPKIKWPNDVLINGKKVCGILAESIIKSGKLKGIIVGIGINLNADKEKVNEIDRPATALNLELDRFMDKNEFMKNLLEEFFSCYDEFLNKGFSLIKDDYDELSILKENSSIKVAIFNKIIEGKFNGFDSGGNLLLLLSNGSIEKINMGEII